METQKLLKPFQFHIKDCQALNSYLEIIQTSSSSKPYILLIKNLMEAADS